MLISHFASASGGLRPQTPYRSFAHEPHWGTSVPRPCGPAAKHVNPLHCKIPGTPLALDNETASAAYNMNGRQYDFNNCMDRP